MRLSIPDMNECFAWLQQSGHAYVVMRGFQGFAHSYPAHGAKEDVDLLVADAAIAPLRARYGAINKRHGVKCDIYDVTGAGEGAYLGHSYYPPALAEQTLATRVLWHGRFYVPDAQHHFLTLIYHLTYHKAERAKIDRSDPAKSAGSKYIAELDGLKKTLAVDLPHTLDAFHQFLKQANYAMPYRHYAGSLQNDFAQHVKSFHMAQLVAEQPGELNLFVIRHVALKAKRDGAILDELRKHYTILAVKPIPWVTRQLTAGMMRGGKWRRGGKPCVAVVVYDPHPQPTGAADRAIHPFVFNNRQFFKRALREWFTRTAGTDPKSNPIHSTDNEAEALGHLNLFFSAAEQNDLLTKIEQLRRGAA